jgi:hypothetical protein
MASCGIDQPSATTGWTLQQLEQGAKVHSSPLNDQHERDVTPLVPNIEPSLRLHPRPSSFDSDQLASDGPSIGRRLFRALTRFFIAVLIGVGATLAWQSHGDEAKQIVRTWVPSLGWLLPPDGPVSSQNAALPQSPPVTQSTTPASGITAGELVQQLEPITRDLAVVRRSLEQLAAKQEQMAQNIATLQAAEQDIRQKMSSPPPSRPAPPRKPPESAAQSPAVQSSSVPSPPPPGRPPLPVR